MNLLIERWSASVIFVVNWSVFSYYETFSKKYITDFTITKLRTQARKDLLGFLAQNVISFEFKVILYSIRFIFTYKKAVHKFVYYIWRYQYKNSINKFNWKSCVDCQCITFLSYFAFEIVINIWAKLVLFYKIPSKFSEFLH